MMVTLHTALTREDHSPVRAWVDYQLPILLHRTLHHGAAQPDTQLLCDATKNHRLNIFHAIRLKNMGKLHWSQNPLMNLPLLLLYHSFLYMVKGCHRYS